MLPCLIYIWSLNYSIPHGPYVQPMMQMRSLIFAFLCITVFDAFSKQIHSFVRACSFVCGAYNSRRRIKKRYHKVFDIWTAVYVNRWLEYTICINDLWRANLRIFEVFSRPNQRYFNYMEQILNVIFWPVEFSNKIFWHGKFNKYTCLMHRNYYFSFAFLLKTESNLCQSIGWKCHVSPMLQHLNGWRYAHMRVLNDFNTLMGRFNRLTRKLLF